jgi:hypothetical protein
MNTEEQIVNVKEIVGEFFNENSMHTGIDNMNEEDSKHVIDIGTSILCTKWAVGYQGGGFVQAVVENDLTMAISRADGTCIKALKFFIQLMNNVGRPEFE